jgi:hypothetical protein
MATYLYETLARRGDGNPVRRFEYVQSMKDPALTTDPETALPVRRVPQGGYGTITGKRGYGSAIAPRANASSTDHPPGSDCCGTC